MTSLLYGFQYDRILSWAYDSGMDLRSPTFTNDSGKTAVPNTSPNHISGLSELDKVHNIYDLIRWRIRGDERRKQRANRC